MFSFSVKDNMSWKTVNINSDLYTYEYFLEEYVCRICWSQNGEREISSILKNIKDNYVTLAETIIECIGIDLAINNRLTKICANCWNEVENLIEFRTFCHQTQTQLYEILQKGPQKLTNEDSKDDSNSIEDYRPSESNDLSDLELANTITNLFGDLNKESDKNEELSQKETTKIKKIKPSTHCISCKTDFVTQDLFTQHSIEIHNIQNGIYKCFGCEKAFKDKKGCLRHESEHCKVLKNGYKCRICKKTFQRRRNLENHLLAHKKNKDIDLTEEIFQCRKCVKQFKSMESLNEHMKVHVKDKKNWVCDTCGRVFTRRDYLYKHKLMHEGLKQYVCPHCGFRTIQKSSLNVHIRKHTGERPYACAMCPQRCVNSSNLREHMKRHLGIKQFQCKLCDKKFGYKLSLEEHVSSIHERSEVHSCEDCGATYSRFRGLKRHLAAKHGKLLRRSKTEENQEKELKDSEVLMIKNTDGAVFL